MKLIFDDPTFSLQLLRPISQTYYKGADIGECLSTAYRIRESDFESWYNEWYKTANRVHYYAKECLKLGHKISAKEAYLRASNYYRVAEFFIIDPNDVRSLQTWRLSKHSIFSVLLNQYKFLMSKQNFLAISLKLMTIPRMKIKKAETYTNCTWRI